MVPLKVSVVSATTVGEKRKLRQQLLQYHINPLRLRASLSSVSRRRPERERQSVYRDARDADGTQRRGGRRGRRAVTPKNTSGMSFALDIALSFEAIWQNSSTSVLAQKLIKMRRRCIIINEE